MVGVFLAYLSKHVLKRSVKRMYLEVGWAFAPSPYRSSSMGETL